MVERAGGSVIVPKDSIIVAPRCRLIRNCTFKQQLETYAVKSLLGRNWEMGMFACFLCSEIACLAMGGISLFFKTWLLCLL